MNLAFSVFRALVPTSHSLLASGLWEGGTWAVAEAVADLGLFVCRTSSNFVTYSLKIWKQHQCHHHWHQTTRSCKMWVKVHSTTMHVHNFHGNRSAFSRCSCYTHIHSFGRVNSKSTYSQKAKISTMKRGYKMDGWPLHARLCTLRFLQSDSVQTLQKSFRWDYKEAPPPPPPPPQFICMQKDHLHTLKIL